MATTDRYILTDKHRDEADRRDLDGAITSLTVARELYRQQVDREYADRLVMAVYLRGVEIDNRRMSEAALDIARMHGFASALVPPLTVTEGVLQ